MTFPIVAVASSAGGLEALSELLEALPEPSDMAVIVVAHLSAEHESLLAELLARRTAIPVQSAADGLRVRPHQIYVIAPDTSLTIRDELLQVRAREREHPHHPADRLFTSLAEAHRERAIGVVLSGGDADGSLGVQAIKLHGGLAFAQEPATARFPSMPLHAIDTGCIDFVLPPTQIGRELGRLSRHPYVREGEVAQEPASHDTAVREEEQLKRVFRRVRVAQGVDFSHYKRSTIQRRLARRMAVRMVHDIADYVALLESDPAEVAALYQDFLIRVTQFFRDPEAFEALRSQVLPRLCAGRTQKEALRIWVPGCATGEEVYSLAITLAEYLDERLGDFRIQIFGSDLSDSAIESARAGVYPATIAADVSPERLERFFTREDGARYRIARSLRDLCIFSRQDVTHDPPFSRLDLLSSRNLLIYLDGVVQRRVMQMFHYALRPAGFLLLGSSESAGAASELFELIDRSNRIYTRKGVPNRLEVNRPERPARTPAETLDPQTDDRLRATESSSRSADRLLLAEYAPASLLVDEELNILQIRGGTGAFLELASGAPSLNLARIARPELLIEISPALAEARERGARVRREGLRVNEMTQVTMQVIPLKTAAPECTYLIILEDASRPASGRGTPVAPVALLPESEKDRKLVQLERELIATRQYMQAMTEEHESVREELKSASEEVLSANEEFQSTNEELETAKEELQSTNEELTTTNEELRERNRELSVLNDDVRKARALSERARAYADAIVETVREPLLVLDGELKILRANRAFYIEFKLRREDLEGKPLPEVAAARWNTPEFMHKVAEVISRNADLDDYDLQYTPAEGSAPRTLRVNARKILGDDERAELILLALEDITELRATATQLREANVRKDEFLAMLAHELRNPLTPITHAMVLLRRGRAAGDATRLYELIERQVTRLRRLVDELLDISRISHGQIELRLGVIDLREVVQNAREAMKTSIDDRQHELTVTLPSLPVWVWGDAVRLEQVIANLLENAAKYTEPGGRISLELTQQQGDVLLRVKDSGIGIAPDRLESIFDLFTQVDNSLDRAAGGLGIGLTLVRRVLELHHGRIEARSAGLGAGSEFIVRLPQASPPASSDASGPLETRAAASTARLRVLIVDDNVDVADALALLASSWGHEVQVARNGPAALEIAARFQPQRALVDIGLPGMDGYEVGRRLRATAQHPELYLVAMTGYGQSADRDRALAAGFDKHLVKPGDPDELQGLLANGSRTTPRREFPQAQSIADDDPA